MRSSSLLVILPLFSLAACATPTNTPTQQTESGAVSSVITGEVPEYEVQDNFKNVYNIDFLRDEVSDPEALALLEKNSFVVLPKRRDEFFSTYEENRYRLDPNFVTSDSLLHTYHLLFDHVLQKTEEEKLSALARVVTTDMLDQSVKQHAELKGTSWENAAQRNVAFFAVAKKLLEPQYELPQIARAQIQAEIRMIAAHDTVAESAVMNMGGMNARETDTPWGTLTPGAAKEDYTQYIPRGHYDRNEQLQQYFRAMMWYGRQTFRFKNPDEVKSAILITKALDQQTTKQNWEKLYEITSFFVGESDDLTFPQLKELADKIYKGDDLKRIAADEAKLQGFMKQAAALPAPKINSIPVFRQGIEGDREQEIKGFRFMGQRFTLDAAVMQKLMCREVGTKDGQELCGADIPGSRMLPKGLDIAAAFGSEEALQLLDEMGETDYLHYRDNMERLRQLLKGYDKQTWTQNLYWGWLYAIDPLLDMPGEGMPLFMQNTAWLRKQLQTFLGSWTELKHDTILYSKQPYAELGGGGDIPEKDDRGYVEPVPLVYDRLALLSAMTRDGLAARNLLPDSQRDNLKRMEELSNMLQRIAEKELANQPLSEEDYELIRSYGGQIEHLWYEVNKEAIEKSGMSQSEYLAENPAAIVADVATNPGGEVLQEATGWVYEIFVLVPVEGRLKLLNGTVYSYYEFPWPMADRLTDKRWRAMLRGDEGAPTPPAQPEWTKSFTGKNELFY